MSLTSQIVTAEFPDLEKVERLNTEAFPEEERTPLSELLRYGDGEYSHFFAFYDGNEFVGFVFSVYNDKAFYISFFAIMPHLRSHGYGGKIIDKLVDLIKLRQSKGCTFVIASHDRDFVEQVATKRFKVEEGVVHEA